MLPPPTQLACKICGSTSIESLGSKVSAYSGRTYQLHRCAACAYAFVPHPWLDYPAIYSEAYYNGRGADPLVDYVFELQHPSRTIRQYEWRGIMRNIAALVPLTTATRWLDFGSGNGGLVRFARAHSPASVFGYEHGWISTQAAAAGIPTLTDAELDFQPEQFDIVTAIEVLEHCADPLAELRKIRKLLKPGGLLFLTTGNAAPQRQNLVAWNYFIPDIHISLYQPETLFTALRLTGFRPEQRGYLPGYTDIIRFKVLKVWKLRQPAVWEKLLPWPLLSRFIDGRFKVTAHPIGWADPAS